MMPNKINKKPEPAFLFILLLRRLAAARAAGARAARGGSAARIALLPIALGLALGNKEPAAAMLLEHALAVHLLGEPAQHLLKPFPIAQFHNHAVTPFFVTEQPGGCVPNRAGLITANE
jgi:hypothetical protein